jgi:ferritin-like metal-binding protein YciE
VSRARATAKRLTGTSFQLSAEWPEEHCSTKRAIVRESEARVQLALPNSTRGDVMSTQMSDPRELFLHELGDVLYAERTLVKALPKLQEEASDEELAQGFGDHLEETRQHVKNLEQAFEVLGEDVKAEKCPGIEGLKKEHDDFVANESPSPEVLDAFLTGAGARTEHYEIAAYEGLVTMADAMGEDEVAKLLTENLDDEKAALRKIQNIGKRLAKVGAKAAA